VKIPTAYMLQQGWMGIAEVLNSRTRESVCMEYIGRKRLIPYTFLELLSAESQRWPPISNHPLNLIDIPSTSGLAELLRKLLEKPEFAAPGSGFAQPDTPPNPRVLHAFMPWPSWPNRCLPIILSLNAR
jgi:hypothetical protein